MSDPDFLGLRAEDLTAEERELLARDDAMRARHHEELALGARVRDLGDVAPAPRVRRARVARRWPIVAAGVAMAAALLLTVAPPQSTLTPRGLGAEALSVRLDAVETTRRRPLKNGDRVGSGEAVAFRVVASHPGTVRIVEDGGTLVYPPSGAWRVEAGSHWLGGETAPLQWTTDAGAGPHRYQVELCGKEGDCVTQELELVWSVAR